MVVSESESRGAGKTRSCAPGNAMWEQVAMRSFSSWFLISQAGRRTPSCGCRFLCVRACVVRSGGSSGKRMPWCAAGRAGDPRGFDWEIGVGVERPEVWGEKLSRTLMEQWSVFMAVGAPPSSCSVFLVTFWCPQQQITGIWEHSGRKVQARLRKSITENGDESNGVIFNSVLKG